MKNGILFYTGIVLLTVLFAGAGVLLHTVDRQLTVRTLRRWTRFLACILGFALVAACTLMANSTLLRLLAVAVAATGYAFALNFPRNGFSSADAFAKATATMFRKGALLNTLRLTASVLAGVLVTGTIVSLTTTLQPFMTALLLLLAAMPCTAEAQKTYLRTWENTTVHRQFLLASGATTLESIIPSIRRALRDAVLTGLKGQVLVSTTMLLALMAGGIQPKEAVFDIVMFSLAFPVTVFLSAVAAITLANR